MSGGGGGLFFTAHRLASFDHVNVLSLQKINTGNKGKTKLCTFDQTGSGISMIFEERNHCAAVTDAVKTTFAFQILLTRVHPQGLLTC